MELFKLLSTSEIFAQLICFLVLFGVLRIFAWKKILGFLDARRERIANEFKKIETAQSELASVKKEYEDKIASIELVAQKKMEEALARGKEAVLELKRKAHQDAHDIIESAHENIKHELVKAKEELKLQVIDLTLQATEDVIQERLTEETDRRIIKDFLERLDQVE